ncbi:MAG: zinc-binding dehydrogenase [Anaerolineae bacterium]|nr:zinc-binding dehydrogenase [Anaerolineae bacterium]MCB9109160.1 zinc-binding dehydrogenase [Anaerolineales bacterium]
MTIKARGAVARIPDAPVEIEEFTLDDPGPRDVVVRILASGVCHTDLGLKTGTYGTDGFPFLLGHEGAGVVQEVGSAVTRVKVGDHVMLNWRAPCGECRFCLKGQHNYCASSHNAQNKMRGKDGELLNPALGIGTFCTHTLVHEVQCVKYDGELSAAAISLIGCGVVTGVGAALYSANVQQGTSVAVFGCGGVGDSVIQGAKLAGATTIIAVDLDPQKLAWAKEFGATHTVNAGEVDPVAEIKRLTDGHGVNYSFEAVGLSKTLEQALFCRDLAGTCVLIGVPGPGPRLNLELQQFFDLGGSLTVSWYGNCIPARDFPILADWYQQGKLDLDRLVSRTISLEETEAAFDAMKRGETLRSVIVFDS